MWSFKKVSGNPWQEDLTWKGFFFCADGAFVVFEQEDGSQVMHRLDGSWLEHPPGGEAWISDTT